MGDPGVPGPQGLRGGVGDRVSGCPSRGILCLCCTRCPQPHRPMGRGLAAGGGSRGRAQDSVQVTSVFPETPLMLSLLCCRALEEPQAPRETR